MHWWPPHALFRKQRSLEVVRRLQRCGIERQEAINLSQPDETQNVRVCVIKVYQSEIATYASTSCELNCKHTAPKNCYHFGQMSGWNKPNVIQLNVLSLPIRYNPPHTVHFYLLQHLFFILEFSISEKNSWRKEIKRNFLKKKMGPVKEKYERTILYNDKHSGYISYAWWQSCNGYN